MSDTQPLIDLLPYAYQSSNLPLGLKSTGKVRDWYSLEGGRRLLVTTDRLSAFDQVLAAIPFKGQVLNQLSAWWFEQTRDVIPNHLRSVPDPNAMEVSEVAPFPVEVIVRGFITGVTKTALWYRYSLGERQIYGYSFPEGLHKNEPLPQAIITPTTKGGPTGHDERLTVAEVVSQGFIEAGAWEHIMAAALGLFARGQAVARRSGMILVDTKYEFGLAPDGQILLIDEVHTPDSSRFWKAATYADRLRSQLEPENYDKEIVRLGFVAKGYQGSGTPPVMADEFWASASALYIQAYELLTGKPFIPGSYPVEPRLISNLKKAGILT
jgi:phosphoribosylaminoimidazole-succinocarboxamide synthase